MRATRHSAVLCVSIDCECDKGPKWRLQRPMAFRATLEGIRDRLQPLFRRYRAKPTYLLSPELLFHGPSVDMLRTLQGDHELGTHLHGEMIGPQASEPLVTAAFQRDYPPEVERDKLTQLTDGFVQAFGRRPTSFRAGRFGIGACSLGILEGLGYAVESSVTPFVDWNRSGAHGLSFVGAPTQPYHPDPTAPQLRGSSAVLEVPITIRPRRLGRVPLLGRLIEPRWLRPTWGTSRGLIRLANETVRDGGDGHPGPVVLNAMFHNVEIVGGTSPYASNEAAAQAILQRLEALLRHARDHGIRVIGLSDVPEVLS